MAAFGFAAVIVAMSVRPLRFASGASTTSSTACDSALEDEVRERTAELAEARDDALAA